ncbi:MAG: DUF4012 domain-containing protein [bacterium]
MRLVTEVVATPEATLIIGNAKSPLVQGVRAYLAERDQKVISASDIPPRISDQVTLCICFTDIKHLEKDTVLLQNLPRLIFVLPQPHSLSQITQIQLTRKHLPHLQYVLLSAGHHPVDAFVTRLMEFVYDPESPGILQLQQVSTAPIEKPVTKPKKPRPTLHERYVDIIRHPPRTIAFMLLVVALSHFIFIFPYLASLGILWYSIYPHRPTLAYAQNPPSAFYTSRSLARLTHRLYDYSRPGLSLFGLSRYPDAALESLDTVFELSQNAGILTTQLSLLSAKIVDPTSHDQTIILDHLKESEKVLSDISQSLSVLQLRVPAQILQRLGVQKNIDQATDYLARAQQILQILPDVLAKDTEKTYVVLFANNYELRPGGGFIGSFALIKFREMHIADWKVYDVYDADGQLKARVPPPEPISKYLSQPFYFLRDSAFTGDFPANVFTAEDFLRKELQIEGIDGAMLVTMHSLEELLSQIGPLKISEYNDVVTNTNVYLKTQLYSERKSFAGSSQKKDFIDALFTELIYKLSEPQSALKAGSALEKSLNQKQVALYSKDSSVQSLLDKWYWSGRQLPYQCLSASGASSSCVLDCTYPLEANLGVNKANAFVTQTYKKTLKIDSDMHVQSTFEVEWNNSSYEGLYPGGAYKNYFQVLLPPKVTINQILLDGNALTTFDVDANQYTQIGMLIDIPARQKRTLQITYTLPNSLSTTNSQLQVIIQKQLGLSSTDMLLKLEKPTSMGLLDTNTVPLAGSTPFEYNSTIDSDKFYYFTFSL